jgi:hypothetical protein
MRYSPIRTDFTPSPSGSGEVLFADAGSVSVVYYAENDKVAVATFLGYAQLEFGYPNDEASSAIYPGLSYGFYEVVESRWSRRLNRLNALAFPAAKATFNRGHYLALFHETTLNVLAVDLDIRATGDGFRERMSIVGAEFAAGDHTPSVVPRIGEEDGSAW